MAGRPNLEIAEKFVELRRAAFDNMPRGARYGCAGSGTVAL